MAPLSVSNPLSVNPGNLPLTDRCVATRGKQTSTKRSWDQPQYSFGVWGWGWGVGGDTLQYSVGGGGVWDKLQHSRRGEGGGEKLQYWDRNVKE